MGHEIIHGKFSQEDDLQTLLLYFWPPGIYFLTQPDLLSLNSSRESVGTTDDVILPETSDIPNLQTETEEPTSAADVITQFRITDPTEDVTRIKIPHELSYEQLSSSDEGDLDRE